MIAHRNILKDTGRILFWFPLRWVVNVLTFSSLYWLGGILGSVDSLLFSRKRCLKMAGHISEVFGWDQKQSMKTVRRNLRNHSRNVLELVKYSQISEKTVSSIVSFENIDYLETELKKGKGVILLTAHFGAKQMLQLGLGLKGHHVNQINYHMSSEELSWVQKYVSQKQRLKIEEKIPTTFIAAKGFMRSAYECLKKNQILIIAGDGIGLRRHMDDSYVPFDFLGKKMLFPTGPVSMAKRVGSGVLAVFVVREKDRHRIIFEPPIDVSAGTNETAMIEYINLLEKYIRQRPCLWEFWEEFEEGNLIPDLLETV